MSNLEKNLKMIPTRNGYGEGLVELGKNNKDIVVLCADISDSTKSGMFRDAYPDRFIQTGIAEQNMMGLAVGLALTGKIPFVSTYAVFCPGLNWSQIRVNVCQNNANVKITGAHAGISVGPDGMSHQALEDIAIMRCLPGMVVLAPCDAIETKKATIAAAKYNGPVYLRFAREATPVFTTEKTPFKIGQANVLKNGSDVTIIACGPLVYKALLAAEKLKDISVRVINNHTIKPLDEKTILKAAKETGAIVTVEEHQVIGGLGSAVAEYLSKNKPVPIEMIGVQDRWGESGDPDELIEKFGMGVDSIIKAVKKVINKKI
ncbi:transketolase family protein [Patescibacteria group bacterium]|nr:transketolase family protein [Patescibacteria group bacterium]